MRRVLAVLIGAGIAVGGGVAWAHPGGPNREAAKACLGEARAADPDAEKPALRAAVRECLEAQGITVDRDLTEEEKARREALRACLKAVKDANPDAERAELREAAKRCFDEAGISPRTVRPRLAELRECRQQVRADHPDAEKAELRQLVRECVRDG